MKKLLLTISFILLIALIVFVFIVTYFQKRSLPKYNGEVYLKNLQEKVNVYFDSKGMPHIIAENELDLYRAAGYITARERMWQMDLIRRATEGRLSEIFGKDFIETDLFLRMLDIKNKSQKIYNSLDTNLKAILWAYADGVNQYLEQYSKKLPFEFAILGYKPEKWTPIHSLNIIGYMAWDLETAWENEFVIFKLAKNLDSTLIKYFIPYYDSQTPVVKKFTLIENNEDNLLKIAANNLKSLGIVTFTASNNWTVKGDKTKTTKPILCNDMHLGFSIPGIWYQMHLIIEGKLNVTGVTIPGAPGIISGHNNFIAWGMTNVMTDGADFYIEKINKDSTKYFCNGMWIDLKITTEKIVVNKKDTVTHKILWTHRGPIISKFQNIDTLAISMKWIGHYPSNEFQGVYLINKARNWYEFLEGLKYFKSISQNFVYADITNNIGLKTTGLIPKRKKPGYFIYDGTDTLNDWNSFVDFDSLPVSYNPPTNFLVSANNLTAKTSYYISQYFYQDFRYNRIHNLLKNNKKITTDYMAYIQTNFVSELAAQELNFIINNLKPLIKDKIDQEIYESLLQWNYELSAESNTAAFFETFNMFFVKNSIYDETKDVYNDLASSKILFNNILLQLISNPENQLYDDITTQNIKENLQNIFEKSYEQTKKYLIEKLGKNPKKWQYGQLHRIVFKHPLSKVKIIDLAFNLNRGPFPVGGSNHTVCPYTYNLNDFEFNIKSGASQRHIYDLDNWDNSLTVLPTGQSGLPSNPYYCNQTDYYLNGKYYKDIFSIALVTHLPNLLSLIPQK